MYSDNNNWENEIKEADKVYYSSNNKNNIDLIKKYMDTYFSNGCHHIDNVYKNVKEFNEKESLDFNIHKVSKGAFLTMEYVDTRMRLFYEQSNDRYLRYSVG